MLKAVDKQFTWLAGGGLGGGVEWDCCKELRDSMENYNEYPDEASSVQTPGTATRAKISCPHERSFGVARKSGMILE